MQFITRVVRTFQNSIRDQEDESSLKIIKDKGEKQVKLLALSGLILYISDSNKADIGDPLGFSKAELFTFFSYASNLAFFKFFVQSFK